MKVMFRLLVLVMACGFMSSCRDKDDYLIPRSEIIRMNPSLGHLLQNYRNDSLKHEAALFLIDNLPYHSGAKDTDLAPMYRAYELFGTKGMNPEQALDSARREFGSYGLAVINSESDVYIDSAYLAENIDWAFKVWREQPWGKNVPFKQFCEYILPYRVGNEELIPWREKLYNQFMPIIEQHRGNPELENPTFAATVVLDSLLKAPFQFTEQLATSVRIGPKIADWRGGSCLDLCDMLVFIYRALGIPCGLETLPMRGNNNAPHYWNFIVDQDGQTWYFSMFYWWHRLMEAQKYDDVYGKVFRQRFSVNREMMEMMELAPDSLHPTYQYPCFEDVTSLYATALSHQIRVDDSELNHEVEEGEMLYLCMPSRFRWIPVDWYLYDGDSIRFNDCHGGTVYCIARYVPSDNSLMMLSEPFSLDKQTGRTTFHAPSDTLQSVTLLSKFGEIGEYFLVHMKDGVFEGANNPSFINADTIHRIAEAPHRLCTSVDIDAGGRYRYVRYYGPDGGHTNVSELEFYSPDSELPLKGRIISDRESMSNPDRTNVFDGKTDTSFGHAQKYGGWIGLDLGAPKRISRIIYTPKNRDNFVRKGDMYELLVCHGGNWLSRGIKISEADSLVYDSIPKGALLLLRNHTRGVAERLFEYKDGKQIYW